VFEFQTKHGSWYLDDVSVKRSDDLGNELIGNGDFNNGISNVIWRYCHPTMSFANIYISSVLCHSGRYCFGSRGIDRSNEYLTQRFYIESDTRYTIEFYTFCDGEPDLFNATITFH
jgi:hypothetical protein